MMRTANPCLNDKTFQPYVGGAALEDDRASRMTLEGTSVKAAMMLGAMIVAAGFTWSRTMNAETAGTVVGVGHYGQFRSDPGYARTMEHTVMLARDARGRGLGRDLMAAIESHARHGGARQMFAGVSGENPAGREFHLALGYRLVATLPEVGWKFGRWMDLWLLAKRL